jgi:glycosyltransferase involved in cell wall biosynthesis
MTAEANLAPFLAAEERKDEVHRPSVSVVVPAFNEGAIIEKSMDTICRYLDTIEGEYGWELIVVDDGSKDQTGYLAEKFAQTRENVHVLHHFVNFNVGQALRFAFNNCTGDYVVVMDMDLSYSPEHIGRLLDTIVESRAKIVLASPYMKGGRLSSIPCLRKTLSICANKFLSYTAKGNFSTLTGMVRAYDTEFLRSLSLRSMDVSISAEIIYKAMILGARIVEIPAHLDWSLQRAAGVKRKSSIKIGRSILAYLLSGFMFRPFLFFIFPGFLSMLLSAYAFIWALVHTFSNLSRLSPSFGPFMPRLSAAVALAFQQAPHTFIIGGISLMLGIQLISLGILSLQSKKYFEEIFRLGTNIYKCERENDSSR